MHNGTRNNTLFIYPDGVRSMGLHISKPAIEWLNQTVVDNLDNRISYLCLFYDLLRQFCYKKNTERGFFRQIDVNAGQTQISENLLVTDSGYRYENPFYRYRSLSNASNSQNQQH